jgi:D-amino-acid dehydrogenase
LRPVCKHITQTMGVQYHFSHTVTAIERQSNNKITVDCGEHAIEADAIVISAGINSVPLLKPLGIALPLQAAESYSAVSTLKTTEYAPSVTLIDETNRVCISRLGHRLRLTGLIGFVPYTQTPHKKAVNTLHKIANDFFPNAVNYSNASIWSRTFALTPNGLPLLGTTSYGNIFVNTGHGANGWAAAVATAKLLTDHIMDHATEIDTTGLFTHL